MDPCAFLRLVVGNIAFKSPVVSNALISPPSFCFAKIKLRNFPFQVSTVTVLISHETQQIEDQIHACFNFKKSEFDKMIEKAYASRKPYAVKIQIYEGKKTDSCGGLRCGKLLGSVSVPLDFKGSVDNRGCLIQNGWVKDGSCGRWKGTAGSDLHLYVRVEPDPRFVFEFDGEPECSPQVFQINGNVRQPVFSCKFSFRNSGDRNLRSSSPVSEQSTSRSWLSIFINEKEKPVKERKGWSITIHDLSGSPVAAASMVTPFVPSPGTDRVSRSNPGAWLILRPGHGTWKPWGRLEAWREHGNGDQLGYRFDLIPDGSIDPITLANSAVSTKHGGKFSIDITTGPSPMTSPSSSFDLGSRSGSEQGSGSWAHTLYRGFVMSSTVGGDGKCSKLEVEVGVQHVMCSEDAAAFVALAAAVDLSMDACRLFSQKIRKELRQPCQE